MNAAESDGEEDEALYVVLRPRNVPRRSLFGNQILDQHLDHSDSYIEQEVVTDSEAAPDKDVSGDDDPFRSKSNEKSEKDSLNSPRRPGIKVAYLEVEESPLSKFSI